MRNLVGLHLYENHLSGPISPELGQQPGQVRVPAQPPRGRGLAPPVLSGDLHELDRELPAALRVDPALQARATWLQRILGIGPVAAATLLAEVPEFGACTRPEVAALDSSDRAPGSVGVSVSAQAPAGQSWRLSGVRCPSSARPLTARLICAIPSVELGTPSTNAHQPASTVHALVALGGPARTVRPPVPRVALAAVPSPVLA